MTTTQPLILKTPYIPYLTLPPFLFASPIASVLLPFVLGLGPGLFVGRSSTGKQTAFADTQAKYYARKQPSLSPPGWIFPVVWSILYPLMGYAAHRAWTVGMASADPSVVDITKRGATLYTAQLVLNLCFTPLYFGLGRPVEALVDIAALTGTVYYLAYVWAQVDDVAVYCLLPYIAWLSFATYLCAGQGYLNNWNFASDEKKGDLKEK
jgi:translocator protein